MMRYLMRLNVEKGTAEKADVPGYYIGGKTGTADKVVDGRYSKTKVLTDFMAVLPADQPRYLLLIMLDEPHATPETHGFTTSGWNAVPTGGAVVARIAPLLGIAAAHGPAARRSADTGLAEGKQVRPLRRIVDRAANERLSEAGP